MQKKDDQSIYDTVLSFPKKYNTVIWNSFFVLLSLLVVFIIYKINEVPQFYFSDQHEFFATIGGNGGPFHVASGGRFVPLDKIEFYPFLKNLLSLSLSLEEIAQSIYFVQSIKALLFLIFYFLALYKMTSFHMAILGMFVFIGISPIANFYPVSSGTIFPESMLILCLAIFIFAYLRSIATQKIIYYILSFVAMVGATYLKEPSFLLFTTFLIMRVFFQSEKISKKEKILLYAVLANTVVYIFLYFCLAYSADTYAAGRVPISRLNMIFNIFIQMPFVPIILSITILRAIQYVYFKSKIQFQDTLMAMSCVYCISFFILKLDSRYYFLPAFVLFFISILSYTYTILNNYSWNNLHCSLLRYRKLVQAKMAVPLVICISIGCLSYDVNKFNFYKPEKIITKNVIDVLDVYDQLNLSYVAYLPDGKNFSNTFEPMLASWYVATLKSFHSAYNNIFNPEYFAYTTIEPFLKMVDSGHIGQITLIPKDTELLSNYMILHFGFSDFIVSKKHLTLHQPIFCNFAEQVAKNYPSSFYTKYPMIFGDAQKLQCDFIVVGNKESVRFN